MKKVTKIVLASGLILAGVTWYGRKKYIAAKKVLSQLQLGVNKIKNFNFDFPNIKFDIDLALKNPTSIDFGATLTSSINIRKVRIFDDRGNPLGVADANIYKINLPATSQSIINIQNVVVNLSNLLNDLEVNINNYMANDFSSLKFKIDVEAFGKMITLDT